MTWSINRRLNGKNKSTANCQRLLRRYKARIKQSTFGAINKRSVIDVDSGGSVSISMEDISELMFRQGRGSLRHRAHPGNDHLVQNDQVEYPQDGDGGSSSDQGQANQDDEGRDEFVFQVSRDEHLDLLLEDLALSNLKQNQQRQLTEYKTHRADYTANGVSADTSVVRSLQNSLARHTAIMVDKWRELHVLEESLAVISNSEPTQLLEEERLHKETAELRTKVERTLFTDTFDLHYKDYGKRSDPPSQVVMSCLMDVSGSVDRSTKDMIKCFCILLYLFLSRMYKNTEVVYVRHHIQAREINGYELFYSQEIGGTIVSSALKPVDEVVKERYNPAQWSIYVAQAPDDDNWVDDSPPCRETLARKLLPVVRYYSYIEITRRVHQTLWREYEYLRSTSDNFVMQHIHNRDDIYPVLRELFYKQNAAAKG